MSTEAVADDITDAIEEAVKQEQWSAVHREVDNLSDALVEALMNHHPEFVSRASDKVGTLATVLRARPELPREGQWVAGELRALFTVLTFSKRRMEAMRCEDLARDDTAKTLLTALVAANAPLTNRELSERTGLAEETVSRRLGPLRTYGLVKSTRFGKSKHNRPTALAVSLLDTAGSELDAGRSALAGDETNKAPAKLVPTASPHLSTTSATLGLSAGKR